MPRHVQQAAEARVAVANQRNGGQSAQRAHLEARSPWENHGFTGDVWRIFVGQKSWETLWKPKTFLMYLMMYSWIVGFYETVHNPHRWCISTGTWCIVCIYICIYGPYGVYIYM